MGAIKELQLLEGLAWLAVFCEEHNVSQCWILKSLQMPHVPVP